MITPVNVNGDVRMAITTPSAWDRSIIRELRDGLLNLVTTCLANEDAKDATESRSFFFVMEFTKELIKDFDDDRIK